MGKKALNLRLPHFLVYTVATFAQFFSIFSSKPATFNLEKARDFVQEAWTCDTTKAQNDLRFTEKYTLEEGMKATIDWYRKEKWL
jgi:nucleoside-diphosphate-sugar epimerase